MVMEAVYLKVMKENEEAQKEAEAAEKRKQFKSNFEELESFRN